MDVVIDTSAVMAVIINEPEREALIERTIGATLIASGSILWEIGNAFSAMFRRDRITIENALNGWRSYQSLPIRLIDPHFYTVLKLSNRLKMYAYDLYVIECALRLRAPLLTLDRGMKSAARQLGVTVWEI